MKNEFKILDKKLKKIKCSGIPIEMRFTLALLTIDLFYYSHYFTRSKLYARLSILKSRNGSFSTLFTPIYIIVIFGIWNFLRSPVWHLCYTNIHTLSVLINRVNTLYTNSSLINPSLSNPLIDEHIYSILFCVRFLTLIAFSLILAMLFFLVYLLYEGYSNHCSYSIMRKYEVDIILHRIKYEQFDTLG